MENKKMIKMEILPDTPEIKLTKSQEFLKPHLKEIQLFGGIVFWLMILVLLYKLGGFGKKENKK